MRARRNGGDALHSGNAAAAASTARSTSALLANATLRAERPSDGVYTWPERPDVPATTCPPMKCGTVSAAAAGDRAGSAMTELFVDMVFPLHPDLFVELGNLVRGRDARIVLRRPGRKRLRGHYRNR